MEKIGLYIHIPFCRSKCPYCDFYSIRSHSEDYDYYTMCVLESMETLAQKYERQADTLYFGGGTPSLLGGENIALLTRRAKDVFGVDSEITVECNPSSADDEFFKIIYSAGVNRISLGMQSAVDAERKKLGRNSDSKTVLERINAARCAGINNISLDVMLGVPNQTMESLRQTLDFCIDSGVQHISAYMLKLEEGTYFYNNSDKLNLPDDDATADMYLACGETLEKYGYKNYEISNYAKAGFESKHNLKYWNCEEYLGIGPAAHSFLNGKRFYYPRDIEYFKSGKEPLFESDGGDENEYIMLRLRLSDGIIFKNFEKRFNKNFPEKIIAASKKFVDGGFMNLSDENISLTRKGFLVSNSIIAELEVENEKTFSV